MIFIGSGLSRWSGLPSWGDLVEQLATYLEERGQIASAVRAEAAAGDLLQAASYGFDVLTKPQISDFIRKACKAGIAKPAHIHKNVISLGPHCFITTNYDDLLEQSLRQWQPDRYYRGPVTNRNVPELAEIIGSRSTNFIFKPHGDVNDIDSIILTREQYRQLLPQGEKNATLESIKILLVSRPVIYIGFGLRDPDFSYVRDILANIYNGSVRDHYAIVPHATAEEQAYWRRNFGIHLIGYQSQEATISGQHGELVTLLDSVARERSRNVELNTDDSSSALILALARYSNKISLQQVPDVELPMRVTAEARGRHDHWSIPYDNTPINDLLTRGPERAILVGLPGAGKSYALAKAAALTAKQLNSDCLDGSPTTSAFVIPIAADLKLYSGNLKELISRSLPASLTLETLTASFKCKLFLDSFNEMPREFFESGAYERDFIEFFDSLNDATIVISSRTSDGISKFDFPIYHLDSIDEDIVVRELQKLGIAVSGRFSEDLKELLRKPFYFQLVTSGAASVSSEASPAEIYRSFLRNLQSRFEIRFGSTFYLVGMLQRVAFSVVDRGEEAFPLELLTNVFESDSEFLATTLDSAEVTNWLLSVSLLVPYSGRRLSFIHQSVTEYLAAEALAALYLKNEELLADKIQYSRWDQALLLALNVLPEEASARFFEYIVTWDFSFALGAVRFMEHRRDHYAAQLLALTPTRIAGENAYLSSIPFILEEHFPASECHAQKLREIMELGDRLGGAAANCLASVYGASVKDELLNEFVNKRPDYNYLCNGVSTALQTMLSAHDLPRIASIVDHYESSIDDTSQTEEEIEAFCAGIGALLSELSIEDVRTVLLPSEASSAARPVLFSVLVNMIMHSSSGGALKLAADLLVLNSIDADVAMYFAVKHSEVDSESWDYLSDTHVRLLLELTGSKRSQWSLMSLQLICRSRSDLTTLVEQVSQAHTGLSAVIYSFCATGDYSSIYAELSKLRTRVDIQRAEGLSLLAGLELTWKGEEETLVRLIHLGDEGTLHDLLDRGTYNFELNLSREMIGPISNWLDLMVAEHDSLLTERFARVLTGSAGKDAKQVCLDEFNAVETPYRYLLAVHVLPRFADVSTDEFSEPAVSYLIRSLSDGSNLTRYGRSLLGVAATESFVAARLLPLWQSASECEGSPLREILVECGSRHGIRYIKT